MYFYIHLYAVIIIALIIFWWSYRRIIRPYYEKKRLQQWLLTDPRAKKLEIAKTIFDELKGNVDAFRLSEKERRRLNITDTEFVYGEVEFLSFWAILERVNAQPQDVFYDLGCGAGKAIFVAALCFDLQKCCGIELLPKLYELAVDKKKRLIEILTAHQDSTIFDAHKIEKSIELIHGNILQANIDDASIIFINATCFSFQTWELILKKLKSLSVGTRVITTTKKITDSDFEVLFQDRYLMSWGMNSVNAYIKVK